MLMLTLVLVLMPVLTLVFVLMPVLMLMLMLMLVFRFMSLLAGVVYQWLTGHISFSIYFTHS